MTFDPKSVEVTCVTLPKDHFVQVQWQYIKVHACGYVVLFFKNMNQRSLILRWPLTPRLLRSQVWLYPRIIVSKSHENTSMYIYMWTQWSILQKYHILHTYYIHTYYVQNKWSYSLFLNTVQARQKWLLLRSSAFCDFCTELSLHLHHSKSTVYKSYYNLSNGVNTYQ